MPWPLRQPEKDKNGTDSLILYIYIYNPPELPIKTEWNPFLAASRVFFHAVLQPLLEQAFSKAFV